MGWRTRSCIGRRAENAIGGDGALGALDPGRMTAPADRPAPPTTTAFPLLGALAYAGGVVAYLPFLTLLLPLRVEQLADGDRYGLLAAIMIAGAVAASISGILFGWSSDRSLERGGGRRRWIAAGLGATAIAYAALAAARTPWTLVVAVVAFQIALNAILAPLAALLAEESADREKGVMGGLLAGAQPLAAVVGPLLVAWTEPDLALRLAVIAAVAAACLAPLLLTARRSVAPIAGTAMAAPPRDLAAAWVSRLLVQIAGNVVFAYLLFLMEEFAGPGTRATVPVRVGELLLVANLAPLPIAVVLGRWSDRVGRRKPFLVVTAAMAAGGLAAMGGARDWTIAAMGFCLYAVGAGVFLALQIGFVMQLLPNPRRRGRDLGIVNLSNTAPVLIGPALTWWLATPGHFGPLLFTLAGLSLAGGLAMLWVRGRR